MTIFSDAAYAEIRRRVRMGDQQMAATLIHHLAQDGNIRSDGRGDYLLTVKGWVAAAILDFDIYNEDMENDGGREEDDSPRDEDWLGPWDQPLPRMDQSREEVDYHKILHLDKMAEDAQNAVRTDSRKGMLGFFR